MDHLIQAKFPVCRACGKRPLLYKKWGLCSVCYQRKRSKGQIDTTPKHITQQKPIRRLTTARKGAPIIEQDKKRYIVGVCWGCRKAKTYRSKPTQCGYCARFRNRGFPPGRGQIKKPTLIYLGPLPNSPFVFRPYISEQKNMQLHLLKTYGTEVFDDFDLITIHYAYDLTRLAKKYGFTRERMRQVYTTATGLTGCEVRTVKCRRIQRDIKSMTCRNDPRHIIANSDSTESSVYKGAIKELLFMETAKDKGLDVAPSCNRSADFVVNGKKVEVKGPSIIYKPKGQKTGYYRAVATKNEVKHLDFMAVYHPNEESWFIIPKKVIPVYNGGMAVVNIARKKTNYHNVSKNRYWEYRNAWHLLG